MYLICAEEDVLGVTAISEAEQVAVVKVVDGRRKDCVSRAVIDSAGVNAKYHYCSVDQVWAVATGAQVMETMHEVVCDYWQRLKMADHARYLLVTKNALKEWKAWTDKTMTSDSIFYSQIALSTATH